MTNRENVFLDEEVFESSALSENTKISLIFELCLQPKTKEDLDNLMLDYREKITGIKHSEYFSTLDYVSMYALDYVCIHDTVSFCSVSRTFYLYQMLEHLIAERENRDLTANSHFEFIFDTLLKCTNVYEYSESEYMLTEATVNSILNGNLGFAFYLHKFRLIKLPSEISETCKKIFEDLVNMLNSFFKPLDENVEVDDMQKFVPLHEFLNKVREKQINIRRSIVMFCILTTVAEYRMYEKFEVHFEDMKSYTDPKKDACMQKLMCINICIDATMEICLTFDEIENFTEVFLNPFLTAEVGKSLVETCRKLLAYPDKYYNIRSLKELARLKVRSMFQNSMSIPEQVNELEIPVTLKEFLNFHGEGIWKVLVVYHLNNYIELGLLSQEALEMEVEDEQEIEDGNVRQLGDGSVQQLEGVNVSAKEEGNV